ncbi:MAG: aminodeoxychorismate/anthranilate synthase component II [Planctomycetes bacterium]|nr:aminodeoxychorismate/anthranilate synthase component II [Planctomycetota bacterium]
MILVIDNYDSFTYNLVQMLGELGSELGVRRNDRVTPDEAEAMRPTHLVISPGPGGPEDGGVSAELLRRFRGRIPILGVCLGPQILGYVLGASVVRAPVPMHGKISAVHHRGDGLFCGLPSPFEATRYHSLVVARETVPPELEVTAWTDDGLVMGLAHRSQPLFGVQFHPESIATEAGRALLANFLRG